jgi:hypothetical protein
MLIPKLWKWRALARRRYAVSGALRGTEDRGHHNKDFAICTVVCRNIRPVSDYKGFMMTFFELFAPPHDLNGGVGAKMVFCGLYPIISMNVMQNGIHP